MNDGISPRWTQRSSDQHRVTGTLIVDADLPVFTGHFPGNPLLPGILQIDWAISAVADAFADLPDTAFSSMSRIKFKTPVRPGISLRLEAARADNIVTFSYVNEGSICTEGRLHYHG